VRDDGYVSGTDPSPAASAPSAGGDPGAQATPPTPNAPTPEAPTPNAPTPDAPGAADEPVELTAAQAERAGRRPRDVVLSMLALLVPVFLLLGAYKIFWNGDHPLAFDVSETYTTARHANAFPVLEPQALPSGWSANTATYTPPPTAADQADLGATLRVVYHDPDGHGVQLVQSSGSSDKVLAAELGDKARPGNLVTIGDQPWREYPELSRGGRALVNVTEGRTVIVVGDGSEQRLRELASSLR
jgi:Protein of unknown function (DUF4245)